ncbi:hypothetical protein KKG71_02875 [Patescibacteria group bacterium]|nr:hypothetical protein [Patescibacteria group bacterium]
MFKKTLSKLLLMAILITSLFSFVGCNTETSTAVGLEYEKAVFAKANEDGSYQVLDSNVFQRGESVYLIFVNVGKFKKGEDNMHMFDMDIEVTDSDGNIILEKKAMLGEEGHLELANDTADSPYGVFTSSAELTAGEYSMKLSIYDKIGTGKASVKKTIILE